MKLLGAVGLSSSFQPFEAVLTGALPRAGEYRPGRIPNEYALFLPGEREALATPPSVSAIAGESLRAKHGSEERMLKAGEHIGGWRFVTATDINGVATAIFEKRVTHRGALAYVTERGGVIAQVPEYIGDISKIRPRPTSTPHGVKFVRAPRYVPGPDVPGTYILHSQEDPCYENVAALGAEYIGWSLVANEEGGPLRSLYLDASGKSRELPPNPQATWAPDLAGTVLDPENFAPFEDPQAYAYEHGWSKRTLLGGYLPVAHTGVWNQEYSAGYEIMMVLPPGTEARPMARVRLLIPPGQAAVPGGQHTLVTDPDGRTYTEIYWNCSAGQFYSAIAGCWNRWHRFFADTMPVEIPDEWLLNSARAGIVLSRCSYRGLEPTYQVGEGAYTKIPERSHALFPVAHYEFIWAHQLWNLTRESEPYFQHYLDRYILPDGNFLYNTQDQVEAPLNAGVFLLNSARAYAYTRDRDAFEQRLPVLTRMLDYVLARYRYSKERFPESDRRYGLIWGSPEADLGDPNNDSPDSHPYYFQNATWTWRGVIAHADTLGATGDAKHAAAAEAYRRIAAEMRGNIERSLRATIAAGNSAMRTAGITPFESNDTDRKPTELSSYENHRFMQDWFLADWGDPALDLGHLKHREIAGLQICGLHTDGAVARTSNFMEHGTLAVRIRQDDYRPFLLTLYALACYAADCGNFYSPEDAYLPGSYPGEQSPYGWSAVINSTLQPTMGLRWMLCYEESDAAVCHLQKAAPNQWFVAGERISVRKCPTRFGAVSWETKAAPGGGWRVTLDAAPGFAGDIHLHIHPPNGAALRSSSLGNVQRDRIVLPRTLFSSQTHFAFEVA